MNPLGKLDHLAIAVRDTEEALRFYRDTLGLTVLFSEVMSDAPVRLTHLSTGSDVHLQLVEPLSRDHPLTEWLAVHGEGLHHFCFKVNSLEHSGEELAGRGVPVLDRNPRCGPNGRQAVFLDPRATRGVRWELTSEGPVSGLLSQ
jgi:methylmalonyl-CoA/ethylmalonyl-CoA epimerase